MSEPTKRKSFSAWFFYSRSLAMFLMAVPIIAAIALPRLMEMSDYLMTFYVAGHLAASQSWAMLYPPEAATALFDTPFNTSAHQLLSALPQRVTAIYMYSPITAFLFAPLSLLTPQASMVTWQVISIAALVFCAWWMSRATGRQTGTLFWMSMLFFPNFHTLLIGHLGIVLGMVPLAGGFYLLLRNKPILAGLVWSALFLKPQYIPVTLLVAGCLALTKRFGVALGLLAGFAVWAFLAFVVVPQGAAVAWLHSFRLSDTILSDPRYGYPAYLVCSFPAAVLQKTPDGARAIVKLITYAIAAGVGLFTLGWCTKFLKSGTGDLNAKLPFIFVLGIFVLPLVLPHFLTYDLCVFALAGMVIYGFKWSAHEFEMKRDCLLGWFVANVYLVLWMAAPLRILAQPLILVVVAAELFRRLIVYSKDGPIAAQYSEVSDVEPAPAALNPSETESNEQTKTDS